MTGKSHIIMNVASGVAIFDTWYLASRLEASPEWLKFASEKVADYFFEQNMMPSWVFFSICIFLYVFGALLPDIDRDTSILGRVVYVPVGHRTWFHAIYLAVVFIVCGALWFKPLIWLGLGYLTHLYWDSFSMERTRPLYPSKLRFGISIYYTGQMSEYIFLSINCFVIICYTVLVFQLVHHFLPITVDLAP